jgi:hypothetical protein
MKTTTVKTRRCIMCGKTSTITVDAAAHRRWKAGTLIQKAFPDLNSVTRELLINGTHPACWGDLHE